MDTSRLQAFLTSLAEISHWQFEIWERQEPIFTTAAGWPQPADREALVAKIMNEGMFQQINGENGRFLAGAPLGSESMHSGAIIAWNDNSRDSSPFDIAALASFLGGLTEIIDDGLTVRMELEKTTEELGRSFEDLYLYARITGWIKTMRFSAGMLDELINQVKDTLRVDLIFVYLAERGSEKKLIKTCGLNGKLRNRCDFVERLIGAIPETATVLTERYFVVNDSRSLPCFAELHGEPFRALTAMIQNNENFYGWFGVASFNVNKIFHRSELRLLSSIAEQIAVVITNTDLYRDREQFIIDMVKSLVSAIEAKDAYTRGHSERVSYYSMLMAQRLDLDDQQQTYLHWASILHDIGKIGISEHILNKTGRLTAEEYELVKIHPAKGCNILKPLEPLAGSLPGIVHHHERYDGSGYPDGLRGEEIPLLARIIAVADTFDALNSNRAYRLAKPHPEALDIVKSLAGKDLDPMLVLILEEILSQGEGTWLEERKAG